MKAPEEKQRFLEPFIEAVQRNPQANEALLIFLMVAFEPVRRGVSRQFEKLRSGLTPQPRDLNWSNREEARRLREIDRQAIFDITREAALEAVFGYPTQGVPKFFPWLRGTIAHRALDALAGELPELETTGMVAAQAEAMQNALAGFEAIEGPAMRDRDGMREWRQQIRMRDVFDVVEDFYAHDPVREACTTAIGRLPHRQREAIESYFFDGKSIADIAAARAVAESTIYNQKATAQKALYGDDVFFVALCALGQVRDQARVKHLTEAYPDGVYRDGRRLVVFPDAA
jgi:DNA-directed RNA polymerase specialized sigma24 family protein